MTIVRIFLVTLAVSFTCSLYTPALAQETNEQQIEKLQQELEEIELKLEMHQLLPLDNPDEIPDLEKRRKELKEKINELEQSEVAGEASNTTTSTNENPPPPWEGIPEPPIAEPLPTPVAGRTQCKFKVEQTKWESMKVSPTTTNPPSQTTTGGNTETLFEQDLSTSGGTRIGSAKWTFSSDSVKMRYELSDFALAGNVTSRQVARLTSVNPMINRTKSGSQLNVVSGFADYKGDDLYAGTSDYAINGGVSIFEFFSVGLKTNSASLEQYKISVTRGEEGCEGHIRLAALVTPIAKVKWGDISGNVSALLQTKTQFGHFGGLFPHKRVSTQFGIEFESDATTTLTGGVTVAFKGFSDSDVSAGIEKTYGSNLKLYPNRSNLSVGESADGDDPNFRLSKANNYSYSFFFRSFFYNGSVSADGLIFVDHATISYRAELDHTQAHFIGWCEHCGASSKHLFTRKRE